MNRSRRRHGVLDRGRASVHDVPARVDLRIGEDRVQLRQVRIGQHVQPDDPPFQWLAGGQDGRHGRSPSQNGGGSSGGGGGAGSARCSMRSRRPGGRVVRVMPAGVVTRSIPSARQDEPPAAGEASSAGGDAAQAAEVVAVGAAAAGVGARGRRRSARPAGRSRGAGRSGPGALRNRPAPRWAGSGRTAGGRVRTVQPQSACRPWSGQPRGASRASSAGRGGEEGAAVVGDRQRQAAAGRCLHARARASSASSSRS